MQHPFHAGLFPGCVQHGITRYALRDWNSSVCALQLLVSLYSRGL